MGGARNAHMMRNASLIGNLKERDHLGHLDVDGRIILKWTLQKYHVRG
jgi:hypothetical protein